MPVIHWFRRDLRLADNRALHAAAQSGETIVPVFIFDPAILSGLYFGLPRLAWLVKALEALDADLNRLGSRLWVRYGDPRLALAEVAAETGASALYFNRDYTPYALRRDAGVTRALTLPVQACDDGVLLPPGSVLKQDGTPFTVFTPFKNRWLALPKEPSVPAPPAAAFYRTPPLTAYDMVRLWHNVGQHQPVSLPDAGEAAAARRLESFLEQGVAGYSAGRDQLAAGEQDDTRGGSSFLSPYFRFGMLSPRQVYWSAREVYTRTDSAAARESVERWISELIWREFYTHVLWHFPHALRGSFRPEYDRLLWRDAPADWQAWQNGETGYPVVDAALRQLQAMGWLPNRARMIVASFLSKDLLLDWRAGEQHFMRWLIDGDPAQNNGGWQWSAGTGTDAQPYFRVFNPVTQAQKFDPEGRYVRRWLPELRDVPAALIHAPWTMPDPPRHYPPPIVDHAFARDRALAAFSAARHNNQPLASGD